MVISASPPRKERKWLVGPQGRFSNFSADPRWLSVGFSAVCGLKLGPLGASVRAWREPVSWLKILTLEPLTGKHQHATKKTPQPCLRELGQMRGKEHIP